MTSIERLLRPTEALAAARRLEKLLPSRKHTDMESAPRGTGKRAVTVRGFTYPSMRRAAAACHISCAAMGKWIEDGRASFSDD